MMLLWTMISFRITTLEMLLLLVIVLDSVVVVAPALEVIAVMIVRDVAEIDSCCCCCCRTRMSLSEAWNSCINAGGGAYGCEAIDRGVGLRLLRHRLGGVVKEGWRIVACHTFEPKIKFLVVRTETMKMTQ